MIPENESKIALEKANIILKNKHQIEKIEAENEALTQEHIKPFVEKYAKEFEQNKLQIGDIKFWWKKNPTALKTEDGTKPTDLKLDAFIKAVDNRYVRKRLDVTKMKNNAIDDKKLRSQLRKFRLKLTQATSLQITAER